MSTVFANRSESDPAQPKPAADLVPMVYEELRRMAARKLAAEAPGHTLQTTALVHEVWLQLAGSESSKWASRYSFLAAAADAMRHILLDRARRKGRARHGHGLQRVNLDKVEVANHTDDGTLLRLDEVLTRFAAEDSKKAELVKLRFFVGLTIPQAAAALGITEITARRWWTYARAWLYEELKRGE
jgi:RNA polymerase sigma factor (TIGR02999 family)